MRILFCKFKYLNKFLSCLLIFLLLYGSKSYSQRQAINLVNNGNLVQIVQLAIEKELSLTNLVVQVADSVITNEKQVEAINKELAKVSLGMEVLTSEIRTATAIQGETKKLLESVEQNAKFQFEVLKIISSYMQGGGTTDVFWLVMLIYIKSIELLRLVDEVDLSQIQVGFDLDKTYSNQVTNKKTAGVPVKFEVPSGYTGAAHFIDVINPASDSATDGLTGILDASTEVTDSLLGVRSEVFRSIGYYHKNLSVFNKAAAFYKKNMELKYTTKTKIITVPGTYTLKMDLDSGIIINADNVIIDLNGRKISAELYPAIIIAEGRKGVKIKNGVVCSNQSSVKIPVGILVKKGCKSIDIENIEFLFCKKRISFEGEDTLKGNLS